jgi:PIN domain nuclease of toxin-antitoxin system
MRYLIDTHVLLWSLGKTTSLSAKAREILENAHVLVSVVSWWELSIKFGLGKLELVHGTPEDLWKATQEMDYASLPLSLTEVCSFHRLANLHKDPFDRMLVWQAIKNDIPLLSKDNHLSPYTSYGLQLIW